MYKMHRLNMTYNFLSFNQLISFKLCFKQVSYIASNSMKTVCNKPYKLYLIFIIRNARHESMAFLVLNNILITCILMRSVTLKYIKYIDSM